MKFEWYFETYTLTCYFWDYIYLCLGKCMWHVSSDTSLCTYRGQKKVLNLSKLELQKLAAFQAFYMGVCIQIFVFMIVQQLFLTSKSSLQSLTWCLIQNFQIYVSLVCKSLAKSIKYYLWPGKKAPSMNTMCENLKLIPSSHKMSAYTHIYKLSNIHIHYTEGFIYHLLIHTHIHTAHYVLIHLPCQESSGINLGVYFCIPNSLFCVSDNAMVSTLLWILGGFLQTSVNFKVDCSIYLKNFTDNLRSIM